MSIRSTQEALGEHAKLRDHVEHFLVDARNLPGLDLAARIDVIERTAAFLAETLLPHAAAEERVLYPGAAGLLGRTDDSDSVAEDRTAVRELLAQMALADPADAGALQEVLYALYTLLSAHLWREEELFMRLTAVPDQAPVRALLDRMAELAPPRRLFRSGSRGVSASR